MERFSAIAAVAASSLLLIGCESEEVTRIARNQHTCALWAAGGMSTQEGQSKLGLDPTHRDKPTEGSVDIAVGLDRTESLPGPITLPPT